jgi:Uma2 family endonuclease
MNPTTTGLDLSIPSSAGNAPGKVWTEEEFLAWDTNQLVEFSDGILEFLPMPDMFHQDIVAFLYDCLTAFLTGRGLGRVYFAPLRMRLKKGKIREPDLIYLRPERIKDKRKPPDDADLAMEVVSEGAEAHERDFVTKRREYAKARIGEYWIIDPEKEQMTVLVLKGQSYREHGVFGPGSEATSLLLPGFAVKVDEVFAAGKRQK